MKNRPHKENLKYVKMECFRNRKKTETIRVWNDLKVSRENMWKMSQLSLWDEDYGNNISRFIPNFHPDTTPSDYNQYTRVSYVEWEKEENDHLERRLNHHWRMRNKMLRALEWEEGLKLIEEFVIPASDRFRNTVWPSGAITLHMHSLPFAVRRPEGEKNEPPQAGRYRCLS